MAVSARAISALLNREGFTTKKTIPTEQHPGYRVMQETNNATIVVQLADAVSTRNAVLKVTKLLAERGYSHSFSENTISVTGMLADEPQAAASVSHVTETPVHEHHADVNSDCSACVNMGLSAVVEEPADVAQPSPTEAVPQSFAGAIEAYRRDKEFNPDWAEWVEKEAAAALGFTLEEISQARADRDFRKKFNEHIDSGHLTTQEWARFLGVTEEELASAISSIEGKMLSGVLQGRSVQLYEAAKAAEPAHPSWLQSTRCVAAFPWEEYGVPVEDMDDWGPKLAEHIRSSIVM